MNPEYYRNQVNFVKAELENKAIINCQKKDANSVQAAAPVRGGQLCNAGFLGERNLCKRIFRAIQTEVFTKSFALVFCAKNSAAL